MDTRTAIAFLDESGAISQDRFFAVGCLKLAEPSVLLRRIQKLRDRYHWYGEYEQLATQLLVSAIGPGELVTVLADNYSAPDEVVFEQDVKRAVNRRLQRLAVTSVCRLDSNAADPLQLVDLMTSGVTFEFRQAAGLAGRGSPKARLAEKLRIAFEVSSFLRGCRRGHVNVQLYRR